MGRFLILVLLIFVLASSSFAVSPTVTNVVARQRTDGSGMVDITYVLADPDSATVYISVEVSTDGGATYSSRSYVTGDLGRVRPGGTRRIVWDAKAALGSSAVFPSCRARITADDSAGGVYPGQMIYIPAGSFLMGNSGIGNDLYYDQQYNLYYEKPQHSVNLSGYWIGKYEVTRGEYRAFMNAGGYLPGPGNTKNPYWSDAGWSWRVSNSRTEPAYWAAAQDWYGGQPFTQTDSHPVVGVTYYEAEAFCNWAGGHLPTEAQWEKAARWTGSHPNVYPWGDTWDQQKCNNWYDSLYPGEQTAPVGSYPSGASPYGCQDMAGNVGEFCKDWYGDSYYGQTPPGGWSDPQGPTSGIWRVLRGGSWYTYRYGYGDCYDNVRCAYRSGNYPEHGYSPWGFRLVR